jgi:hypothetical protein
MLGLVCAFTSFNLFADGPLAFYIAQAVFGSLVMLAIAKACGGRIAVVCLYGAFLYGSTAACGSTFSQKANGWQYLCDAGTGAPISAITLAVGMLIAGWLLGGRDG